MPVSDHSIAERVKLLRSKKGWSQTDLAHHTGVTQSAISGIENGRSQGRLILGKLAAAFGISYEELSNGDIDCSSDHPKKPQQQNDVYLLGRLMAFESVCKCIASQNPEMMDLVAKLLMNIGINTQAIPDIRQHEIEDLKNGWESALITLVKRN